MKSQRTNKNFGWGAVIGFALMLLPISPQTALAQQWNTNGNHISNANTGNVGIGTTSPNFTLDVARSGADTAAGYSAIQVRTTGAAGYGPALILDGSSITGGRNWQLISLGNFDGGGVPTGKLTFYDATAGAIRMTLDGFGNVGIGTTLPAYALDVRGGFLHTAYNTQSYPSSSPFGGLAVGWNRTFGSAEVNFYNVFDNATTAFQFSQKTGASTAADLLTIMGNGNVGIGTTSPGRLLEIRENNTGLQTQLRLFHGNGDSGFNPGSTEIEFLHAGNQLATSKMRMVRTFNGTGSSNTDFYLDLVRGNGGDNGNTTNTALFAQGLTGNLGIGTTSPGYRLDVQGGSINTAGGFCIAGDCKTAWSQVGGGTSQWTTASPNIYYNTGNVGIGTTTPGYKLDVAGSINTTGVNVNGSPITSSQWTTSGTTINYSAGNVGVGTATPGYKLDVAGTVNATGVSINGSPISASQWTTNGTNINYASGNVGIGTTTPTTKLHVVGDGKVTGNLTVDGNIAAKYQDVAEWVPASERISPGTVVVLDSTKSNQVISSAQAYDTRVAGVISEKPGIALGESGLNKVLVATTGRVRIKVDATRGAIHIGDLLVTSDISGMAMKSEPVNIGGVLIHRPGTLIGKALEPLAKGQGEILVLLSLQ